MGEIDHTQQLWDLEQIKRLKSRYYRLQDENRWDEWAQLFTPECEVTDPTEAGVVHRTGASIAARTAELAGDSMRNHRGTMPDIELVDDRTARGTWALFCATGLPGRDGAPDTRVDIFGYYTDEYRKGDDGEWRIHRMSYHNVWTSGASIAELQ
jgi:hypothetical protein